MTGAHFMIGKMPILRCSSNFKKEQMVMDMQLLIE